MRVLLAGVIAGALLALVTLSLGSGEVSADNGPHMQSTGVTTDTCAACHRAHTAQAEKILKQAQPGLCYTCHGTGGPGADTAVREGKLYGNAPDSPGPPYGGKTAYTALRGGGFDSALINTTDATSKTMIGILGGAATVQSWHTEDGTIGTMWGNGALNSGVGKANYNLRCGSCHDPHGNSQYRILRSVPKSSGGAGQSIADETPTKTYDTTNYFDVSYLTGTDISNWCAQCHTRYLAGSGSAGTTSNDAIFTFRHASDGNGVPACIKCHAAHGSNAATDTGGYSEGVPWPNGGVGTTDNNNSRLLKMDNRGICQKCHNQ